MRKTAWAAALLLSLLAEGAADAAAPSARHEWVHGPGDSGATLWVFRAGEWNWVGEFRFYSLTYHPRANPEGDCGNPEPCPVTPPKPRRD